MIDKKKLISEINNQPKVIDENEIVFKQDVAKTWFLNLRDIICKTFVELEHEYLKKSYEKKGNNKKPKTFKKKNWYRDGGGGGVMSIMRGSLFEKVGVNISTVHGQFSKDFKSQIPGAEKTGQFWASGISVVAHMANPMIPAAHMNTRLIMTGEGSNKKIWFGGGCDLTPMIKDKKASVLFHKDLKKMCNKHDDNYYTDFKLWCDNYFFLPHRNESRGVGGIFFDYMNTTNWEKDFKFVKDVGVTFKKIFKEIIKKKNSKKWNKKQKEKQYLKRGRYVEFNLLYDRGTKFGLQTGGNTDAILMSLPPLAKWK